MASKKRYEENPYIDAVLNALRVCVYEYGDARAALENDPDDVRAMISKNFCTDFISWFQETTGIVGMQLIVVITKMLEAANDEE